MILSRLMLITQRARMKPNFQTALQAALEGGARLIQLREPDATTARRLELALRAKQLCDSCGATLIINNDADLARQIGAGLHLPERRVQHEGAERFGALTGASIHSIEAARRIQDMGFDYAVFGHVFETVSHPDAKPRGLEMLREVCASVQIPVFAVGGIDASNAASCRGAGAHGVAVIGAVWDAPDVAQAVRDLI